MAIQIWDAQTGQYKGAELARYGADGTLTEALVWHEGAYRRVWPPTPTGPVPLWEDDFTTPSLHERWTLVDGTYAPPGLSGMVVGPVSAADFEVTIGLPGTPFPSFVLGAMDMNSGSGIMVGGSSASGYNFMDLTAQHVYWGLLSADFAWSTLTLRRTSGMWSVHADGQSVLGFDYADPNVDPDNPVPIEAADPFPGQGYPLAIGGWEAAGSGDTKIASVSYTEL